MQSRNNFGGGIRDIIIMGTDEYPLPLPSIVDRTENKVYPGTFDSLAIVQNPAVLILANQPDGVAELEIKHSPGAGYKVQVKLNLDHEAGLLLEKVRKRHLQLLVSPYAYDKGLYLVIGDIDQPVLLDEKGTSFGASMEELVNEPYLFITTLKKYPPLLEF